MFDVVKLGLLTWGTLFLMILFFVSLILWLGCSVWWLLTNHMLDRTTFTLLSISISATVSLLTIITSLFSEEK
jgi:hypothetical protein